MQQKHDSYHVPSINHEAFTLNKSYYARRQWEPPKNRTKQKSLPNTPSIAKYLAKKNPNDSRNTPSGITLLNYYLAPRPLCRGNSYPLTKKRFKRSTTSSKNT